MNMVDWAIVKTMAKAVAVCYVVVVENNYINNNRGKRRGAEEEGMKSEKFSF